MKYYELHAELHGIQEPSLTLNELKVIKETPKQIQIEGSKTYLSRVNKCDLLKIKASSCSYTVIFVEGQEDEAMTILKETMEGKLNYFQDKVERYKNILKEL